jgi:hypothetical protein
VSLLTPHVVVVEASAGVETSKHAEIMADAATSTDVETSTIVVTLVHEVISAADVVGSTTTTTVHHLSSASTTTVLPTTLVTYRRELTRALLSRLLFLALASSFQDFHDFDHWHDSQHLSQHRFRSATACLGESLHTVRLAQDCSLFRAGTLIAPSLYTLCLLHRKQ